MIEKKRFWIGMFFVMSIMFFSLVSADYMSSNPQFTQFRPSASLFGSSLQFDESQCGQSQDFIIQVAPFGCEPAPVRSDLLEEQNVPVFCQLAATQVNPLIKVNAIESISFSGQYPEGIQAVGFQPAKAALGVKNDLNRYPILDNIGYVVLVVKQYPNESSMPDSINGTLVAKLKYDVKNAFGIGSSNVYLPILSEDEWEKRKAQYSFWNGRGYLRLEDISGDSATISVYDSNKKLRTVTLKEGESSDKIGIPGFNCLGKLELKLYDLSAPSTRAKLIVGGDYVEASRGEKFLEGRCFVESVVNSGIIKKAQIRCKEDDNAGSFNVKTHLLQVTPKIKLNIDGIDKKVNVGDYLFDYTTSGGSFYVYLAYAGTETGDARDLKIGLISLREKKERLSDEEISYVAKLEEAYEIKFSKFSGVFNAFSFLGEVMNEEWQFVSGGVRNIYERVVEGSSVVFVDATGAINVWGEDEPGLSSRKEVYPNHKVSIEGFASAVDSVLDSSYSEGAKAKENYELAEKDYESIKENFASEKTIDNEETLYGESALYNQIVLNNNLGQKAKVVKLCQDFKSEFPESSHLNDVEKICSDLQLSNTAQSSTIVFVNGKDVRITLDDILEPTLDDYSAEITIRGPNQRIENVRLGNDGTYYLDDFRGAEDDETSFLTGLNPVTGAEDIYFKYNTKLNKWTWKLSEKDNYVEVTSTSGAPSYHKDLLLSLEKADFNKGKRIILLDKSKVKGFDEYIQLVDLVENKAKLKIALWDKSAKNVARQVLGSSTYTLELNKPYTIAGFSFVLNKVNLDRNAKVGVIPSVDNMGSEENFSFGIEIEKRAIQLTPEKAKSLVGGLNSSISKLESIGKTLGTTVKTLKGACYITGTVLTLKNFFLNKGGRAIARKRVMQSSGGWNEICQKEVSTGTSGTLTQCFNKHASEIEGSVDRYEELLKSQNEKIKRLQAPYETKDPFSGVVVDDKKFAKAYLNENYKNNLRKNLHDKFGDTITYKGRVIQVDDFVNKLSTDDVSIEELRDLELNSQLPSEGVLGSISKGKIEASTYSIWQTIDSKEQIKDMGNVAKSKLGVDLDATLISSDKTKVISYNAKESAKDFGDIKQNDKVQTVVYNGKRYIVKTESVDNKKGEYTISGVYDLDNGKLLKTSDGDFLKKNIVLKKYDSSSYEDNGFVNAEVRYYQTEPYKGLPAMVPFDTKNGWYVATKQVLPIGGELKSYDKSGRVTSFYIGNVGPNGIEEFLGSGDDTFELYNSATGYIQFSGLSPEESRKIVDKARKALEEASRAYSGHKKNVNIAGQILKVGAPAVNTPSMQCQDMMSPQDCMLLFNVCDPVMCPSSRCNFGGKYRVADPVQTGIIGGLTLCAPNSKEGIVLPVCLSAVNAGVENLITIQKSYRDCLQESLDTGKTVGVCDEMHSIYLCEMLWREGIQLSRLLDVPSLVGIFTGRGNVRGGGEYLTMKSAFSNLQSSVSYFTDSYAVNAINAFRARTTSEIGTKVCRNFVSVAYPSIDVFDALTDPDSPPQFNGKFDEIPFTDTTVPPISHYKVFYHIYAGKDSSAYYKVYLKGSSGGFYEDTSLPRIVAQGYLNKAEYASETKDFTAPAGYKELCILVNDQEECGFQEVSTSFAQDYVKNKYIEEQASKDKIKTTAECVSGSASVYSLVNPNLQEGVLNLRNPEVYNSGIVRTCATDNPGKGTDLFAGTNKSRWIEVGYCDTPSNKCWLDTSKIDDITDFEDTKEAVLSNLQTNVSTLLEDSEEITTPEQFDSNLQKIKSEKDNKKRISLINEIYEKVIWNRDRAELLILRAESYAEIAKSAYDEYVKKLEEEREKKIERISGEIDDRKNVEYYFKTRSLEEVQKVINYAKGKSIVNRKCKCDGNCEDYAKYVYDASKKYNIADPLLMLSIMMQESSCHQEAESNKDAVGLMQIVSFDICKDELKLKSISDLKGPENAKNNVNCGAIILRKKYDAYKSGIDFFCNGYNKKYYRWEAGVRGYVGRGCDEFHKLYVEEVMNRYIDLATYLDGRSPLKEAGDVGSKEAEKILSKEQPRLVKVSYADPSSYFRPVGFIYNREQDCWMAEIYDIEDGKWIIHDKRTNIPDTKTCLDFLGVYRDICSALPKYDELGGYNYLNSLGSSSKYIVGGSVTRADVARQKLVEAGELPEEPVIVLVKLKSSSRVVLFKFDTAKGEWTWKKNDDSFWRSSNTYFGITDSVDRFLYRAYSEMIKKLSVRKEHEGYEYFQNLLKQGPKVVERCENCNILGHL